MAKAPTFEERKAHYEGQWSIMKVKPERVTSVDAAARLLLKSKSRYEAVARKTNVPWFVIAIIHMREASGSFAGVLHNGEKIIGTGRKTRLVPAGRGPFSTWEDAAVDALKMRGMGKVTTWTIPRICYEVEAYNGWGYWWRGDKSSAYLWAGTNIDGGGKYIADHVWSSKAQDAQNGAMAVLQRLMELDHSIALQTSSTTPSGVPAVAPAEPSPSAPAVSRVDPQRQVGGLLKLVYAAVQAVLSRKA